MYLYSKDYATDVLISSSGIVRSDAYDAWLKSTRIELEDPLLRYKKQILNNAYGYHSSEHISKVIFNDPATIVFWADGTKTVVKCGDQDTFDPEKGLAMAIAKHFLGDKGNYYNTFRKWLPKTEQKETHIVVGKVCSVKPDSDGVYITADLTKEGSDYINKMLDTPITMSFELAKDKEGSDDTCSSWYDDLYRNE